MAPAMRRLQLLDAATSVIRDTGASSSMDSIAAAAGVTKPVLYSHFGDKAGLSHAIAEQVGDRLAAEVGAALDPAVEPYEQLRAAISVFVRWVRNEPQLFQFLLASTPGGDTHSDVLTITGRVAGSVSPAITLLYQFLGRDTAPADTYAAGIVGFVYLGVEQWLQGASPHDDDEYETLIDMLSRFAWAGLMGPDQPNRI